MKKILILGASGFVGQVLCQKLNTDYDVFGTYNRHPMEINKVTMLPFEVETPDQIKTILSETTPHLIINCLRGDYEKQLQILNKLIHYSEQTQAIIYFMSTANVFDANRHQIHYETDERNSNTKYGKFKITAENLLLDGLKNQSVICRLPMIWGLNSPRLNALKEDITQHKPVTIYKNLYLNHHTADLLADQIQYLIASHSTGVFHLGSHDQINHADFIHQIIAKLGYQHVTFNEEYLEGDQHIFTLGIKNLLPKHLQLSNEDILKQIKST